MTEDDARDWVKANFDAIAVDRITAFATMIVEENLRQNLVAPSTIDTIWSRHIVDSLQLTMLAPKTAARWLDIGTGGGFPGLVVALTGRFETVLVEPRRLRSEFLSAAANALGVADRVTVHTAKVQNVASVADVISARAVSTIQNLLRAAAHCATRETRWLLPRGLVSEDELVALQKHWRLMFHVEHSATNPESMIVILDRVTSK